MALVVCPDCASNVSDLAPACPTCGRPMAALVTEQTSKSIKRLQLHGAFIFLGGLVALVLWPQVALWVMAVGLGLIVVGAFNRWWNHG